MGRRTPEQVHRRKRQLEGGDFERYGVHPPLEAAGYVLARSHLSRGPFDWVALAPGHVLVIGARLTGLDAVNPKFSTAELSALWRIASGYSAPGMAVVPLLATARHGAAPGALCRCEGAEPEPARFLRLLGPPARQGGQRGNWTTWEPGEVPDVPGAWLVVAR